MVPGLRCMRSSSGWGMDASRIAAMSSSLNHFRNAASVDAPKGHGPYSFIPMKNYRYGFSPMCFTSHTSLHFSRRWISSAPSAIRHGCAGRGRSPFSKKRLRRFRDTQRAPAGKTSGSPFFYLFGRLASLNRSAGRPAWKRPRRRWPAGHCPCRGCWGSWSMPEARSWCAPAGPV